MTYSGFHKGDKFSLAANAYTKGAKGAKPSFSIFYYICKKQIWPKGGHGSMTTKYAIWGDIRHC